MWASMTMYARSLNYGIQRDHQRSERFRKDVKCKDLSAKKNNLQNPKEILEILCHNCHNCHNMS